eukprot:PhM_4_TR10071/c0_g1_i3/m.46885/K15538/MANEA; glycoprotein endo-alpha-1,2-mannosidase
MTNIHLHKIQKIRLFSQLTKLTEMRCRVFPFVVLMLTVALTTSLLSRSHLTQHQLTVTEKRAIRDKMLHEDGKANKKSKRSPNPNNIVYTQTPPTTKPTDAVVTHAPSTAPQKKRVEAFVGLPSTIHAFYYPWYGAPGTDKKWVHWNHPYLPHWEQSVTNRYPKGSHQPPDDVGASYYPLLGPYSSRSTDTIRSHMEYFRAAKVGVCVLSWYPPTETDDNGLPSDDIVRPLLDAAQVQGVKIAFHSEPYHSRNGDSFVRDMQYIAGKYGSHPALLRVEGKFVVYVYDPYHTPTAEWDGALRQLRGTDADCFAIALLLKESDESYITESEFDGVYTYFASTSFTYGSNPVNWPRLVDLATQHRKAFVPSVGPGYDDTKVRPWNGENTHYRHHGEYYNTTFRQAIHAGAKVISITSFNEWHEGTQIEPAVPKSGYHDYLPNDPFFYLKLTAYWVDQYLQRLHENQGRGGG